MRVSCHFAHVFIWGDRFCNSPNILMWTTSTCHRSLINLASAYHLVFTGSPVCGAEGLRGGWMWSNSPGNWFHTGGASCDHWLRRGCAFLQRGLRLTGSLGADNWSKRGQTADCYHYRPGKKEVSKLGRAKCQRCAPAFKLWTTSKYSTSKLWALMCLLHQEGCDFKNDHPKAKEHASRSFSSDYSRRIRR